MKRLVYFIVKRVTRISVGMFFSRLEIVGTENIPRNKPLIFAPNHQNAFLDAFMVGSISPVGIHYLTRADVFNNPFRWFLDALQMMPIYRIRDGFGQLSQNAGVFEACRILFSQTKSVLIFPEGNHGENYYLRPLTKGISRLALESQEELKDKELWIQPVGLNYFDLRRPRRKASVVFGKPIRVSDYMATYHEKKPKALKDLRDDVFTRMKECMFIPDNDEKYEIRKSWLIQRKEHLDFQEMKTFLSEVEEAAPVKKKYPVLGYIGKLLGVVNYPPLFLMKFLLGKKIKDIVFTASIKWGVALFMYPLWWIIIFGIVTTIFGIKIGLVSTATVISLLYLRQELLKLA